jgi:hypothetical protein
MRGLTLTASFLYLVATLGGCGGDGTISSSEDLRSVLASAAPGERVCLEAGIYEGSFDVPAGVELCGAGAGVTRIVGPSDLPTLRVAPGVGSPTRITGVTVESTHDFGILAIGAGDVEIAGVVVRVPERGAGIGVERLTTLRITDVDVTGPVTAASADGIPLDMDVTLAPAYGVVAVSVMSIEGDTVRVSGFAHFGVLSVSSNLTLLNSRIEENLGTGLFVHGGSADLTGVAVDTALQGTRLIPPYNAVFAGMADVSTTAFEVTGSEGYGVLQSEATATHTDLLAENNAEAALWVQQSGGLVVDGAMIRDNRLAGIVALESSGIDLSQVTIEGTALRTRVIATMPVEVGDGVQLLGSTTGVTLESLGLVNNARVGVLLDLDGGMFDGIDIRSVDVDGTGGQLGAIAQNGVIPPGWDDNVMRSPVIDANDSGFSGTLATVGIVGPSDMPAVDAVLMSGLAGIVGPSD